MPPPPPQYDSCRQAVLAAIAQADGWLRFDEFLQLALHDPRYGYYGSGQVQLGAAGDFHTAPLLSPLFAETLARMIPMYSSGGDILELGGGDGTLARQLLDCLPATAYRHYYILETSAALAARQRQTLKDYPQAKWLTSLPAQHQGFILANEVLDCVPFRLLVREDQQWRERGVAADGDTLLFQTRDIADAEAVSHLPAHADGYQTEISPQAAALTATLAACLNRGCLLFADYGFGRDEYYHPQRDSGTMMCYYRQRSDDNPLIQVGEKDISAHVDFTAIAYAGLQGGCRLAGYVTQAQGLINCGITEQLAQYMGNTETYARATAGAHRLLAPQEMGESIKWMGFTKGNVPPPPAFTSGDIRHRL